MKIIPGASFGVASKATSIKHRKHGEIAKNQKEKKSKNFTRDATRAREEVLMQQLSSDKKMTPPTPAVVLSSEQWKAQRHVSMLLKYDGAMKDNTEDCWLPKWEVMWRGDNYSTREGSLVFDADSMGLNQESRYRVPFFRDVVIEGGPIEYSNAMIVLAKWTSANLDEDDSGFFDESPLYTASLLKSIGLNKKSITPVNGKRHHGSCGFHFGYGSVSSYGSLKNRAQGNSVCAYAGNNKHEPTIAQSVTLGARCVNRKFTRNNVPGSSVTTRGTMMNHSVKRGAGIANPLLKPHVSNISGTRFPAVFLCVNAFTLRRHTERDCSYTLITVPKQEGLSDGGYSGYFFNFYLNNKNGDVIKVPMQVGTSIFFSGYFLTHNQSRVSDHIPTFVNISAYGNKKFFQSSQCTIMRNT